MTDKMTFLIAEISEQVGRITVLQEGTISPHLQRENRIRTIHSSLAIEHNSLSLEQVTAILDGKRVLGNPNEIKEECTDIPHFIEMKILLFRFTM